MENDNETKKPYEKPQIRLEEVGDQELLCGNYGGRSPSPPSETSLFGPFKFMA